MQRNLFQEKLIEDGWELVSYQTRPSETVTIYNVGSSKHTEKMSPHNKEVFVYKRDEDTVRLLVKRNHDFIVILNRLFSTTYDMFGNIIYQTRTSESTDFESRIFKYY